MTKSPRMTNCMPYCPTVPQAQNTSVRVVRTPLSPLTLCLSASVFPIFLRAAAPLEACGGVCRHPPIPATAHRRSSLVRRRTADPRPLLLYDHSCSGVRGMSQHLALWDTTTAIIQPRPPTATSSRHGGMQQAEAADMRRSPCGAVSA